MDVTQNLPPHLSNPGKEGLVNLPRGVRNRDMQQNRCWRKCPPHCGQILCICINNSLSHGLTDPGFSVLFPSKSNGVCTPELCVAWRKLVQMSAFFFLPRVTGGLEGCTIIRSSDLLKADFPGPNPGELDTIWLLLIQFPLVLNFLRN